MASHESNRQPTNSLNTAHQYFVYEENLIKSVMAASKEAMLLKNKSKFGWNCFY